MIKLGTQLGFTPFSIWLAKFEKNKSDIGILARWFSSCEFRQVCTKDLIKERMIKMGCSEFLVDTFVNTWNEFEMVPNARISIKTVDSRGRKFRKRLD